jgi:phosphatidylglycerophosphate synthase
MVALRSLPLERFGQVQAVVLVVACPLVALAGHPWPLAAAALLGVGLLLVAQRGRYTPNGSFGAANVVTTLRLLGVVWLATVGHEAPPTVVAALVAALMLLDGLDGSIARRAGTASPFGAHFDVEIDALLVLVLGAALWQRERLGVWALWPGLLRYLYVLTLAVAPAPEPPPRSLVARFAFGGVVAGLVGALLEPGNVGMALAIGGTVLVTASFAGSFYFLYGKSER